jgi:hypothetical protein
MRNLIALLAVLLTSTLASTAAAQSHEANVFVEPHRGSSVAPHLTDDAMELAPPDAGDYVLPIVGVVLGGAAVVAGVIGVLGSALVLAVHSEGSDADEWLAGSAVLTVAGGISLGLSIHGLVSLRRRARAAREEETGVRVFQFTPTAGGAVLGVAGTF